jgi:hypothetical protein
MAAAGLFCSRNCVSTLLKQYFRLHSAHRDGREECFRGGASVEGACRDPWRSGRPSTEDTCGGDEQTDLQGNDRPRSGYM